MMINKGIIKSRKILNKFNQKRAPLVISQNFHSELKGATAQSPLKDIKNIIEKKNYSGKLQDPHQDLNNIPDNKGQIIVCRSLSCTEKPFKPQSRLRNPSILKNRVSLLKPVAQKQNLQQPPINRFGEQFLQGLRDISQLKVRNSILQSSSNIPSIFTQYGKKLLQEASLNNKILSTFQQISYNIELDSSVKAQKSKFLSFQNVCSLVIGSDYKQRLSSISQVLDVHLKYERDRKQGQLLWNLVSLPVENLKVQELNLLLQNASTLKLQIDLKKQTLHELSQKEEIKNNRIISQMTLIASYQNKIREHTEFIKTIQNSQLQINSFLMNQPNKILQQEAQGYKQKEQQLFDLACILQETTPHESSNWISQAILVPQQSLELTLRSFPTLGLPEKSFYQISIESMQKFKKSVKNCYSTIFGKLQSLLEAKCKTIRQFVGTMRRLASYTIGKREYLTEINKKMATLSATAQKTFLQFQKQIRLSGSGQISIGVDAINKLKQLMGCMKKVYNEAEVFY